MRQLSITLNPLLLIWVKYWHPGFHVLGSDELPLIEDYNILFLLANAKPAVCLSTYQIRAGQCTVALILLTSAANWNKRPASRSITKICMYVSKKDWNATAPQRSTRNDARASEIGKVAWLHNRMNARLLRYRNTELSWAIRCDTIN